MARDLTRDEILQGRRFRVFNGKGISFEYEVGGEDPDWMVYLVAGGERTLMGVLRGMHTRWPVVVLLGKQFPENCRQVQMVKWGLQLVWRGERFPEGCGIEEVRRESDGGPDTL